MKIFLAAIAMTIAVPAAAQTGQPVAPGHAEHDQHGDKTGHEGHMKCCEGMADGKKMECCDKAAADGAKMACCDKRVDEAGAADEHAGHDMSDQ